MSKIDHVEINEDITIPLSEFEFQFSTSSGPGGQHANRSATRVTLIFNVTNSPSLDDQSRGRIFENLINRLDKEGNLQIQSQDTRSQSKNREIALSRLSDILSEALRKPKKRKKTKPSLAAKKKRKAEKKKKSRLKKERGKNWSQEF